MRDSVRSAFVDFTAAFEGVVPWMYQDVKGLVTIGIGNLVDPIQYAMPLPFVRRVDGLPAGRDEIAAEWLRVKGDASLARLGHRAAERVTTLRLTDEGIGLVVSRKLEQNDADLRLQYPDFGEWPACAQLAAHSMSWACGSRFGGNHRGGYPKLAGLLRAGDFAAAAEECHISEAGNPGVVKRNVANKVLFRNAARVRDYKLDPDLLDWGGVLGVSEAVTLPALDNPASSPSMVVQPIVHVLSYDGEPEEKS